MEEGMGVDEMPEYMSSRSMRANFRIVKSPLCQSVGVQYSTPVVLLLLISLS